MEWKKLVNFSRPKGDESRRKGREARDASRRPKLAKLDATRFQFTPIRIVTWTSSTWQNDGIVPYMKRHYYLKFFASRC